MSERLKKYREPNKKVRTAETVCMVILLIVSVLAFLYGGKNRGPSSLEEVSYLGQMEMVRDRSFEDYDEDDTLCPIKYDHEDDSMYLKLSCEEYEETEDDALKAYVYEANDGTKLYFDHLNPSGREILSQYSEVMADRMMPVYNLANSLLILAVSVAVMLYFGSFFTTYEKIWFISIMVLATVFAVIFPEESANGVNGIIIMLLYLLDTFLNILCELLISKQSRYNFLVSVLVEITEIVICIVLMYRFATMVVTLFFWLPIDIISFINWSKHKDEAEDELTAVRRLKGWQEVLVIVGIAVWTIVVGYFISGLDIQTDFFASKSVETAIVYIDACASAVGIANGLFIFFRLREQWIAWYVCALLEAIINIMSGQYVLLILKLGYFTNTTYGYIKWSRYIKSHREEKPSLF